MACNKIFKNVIKIALPDPTPPSPLKPRYPFGTVPIRYMNYLQKSFYLLGKFTLKKINMRGETHIDFRVRKMRHFYYLRPKIDLSWINIFLGHRIFWKIDAGQMNFCFGMKKRHFPQSKISMCFSSHIFIFSV